MKKLLLCVILALVSTGAFAEEYLVLNGLSDHVGSSTTHCEKNPGVAYAWDTNWSWTGDIQAQVGMYRNSECRPTGYGYGTKYFTGDSSSVVRFGGAGGLAFGYKKTPVMPMLGLVSSIKVAGFANVNVLLSGYNDEGKIKPLLAAQLAIPFSAF